MFELPLSNELFGHLLPDESDNEPVEDLDSEALATLVPKDELDSKTSDQSVSDEQEMPPDRPVQLRLF